MIPPYLPHTVPTFCLRIDGLGKNHILLAYVTPIQYGELASPQTIRKQILMLPLNPDSRLPRPLNGMALPDPSSASTRPACRGA